MTLAMTGSPPDTSPMIRTIGHIILTGFLVLLALATLEFIDHATRFGWAGLQGDAPWSRLISDSSAANAGVFLHMLTGAVITFLAPLQLIPVIRNGLPALHRWSGRLLVGCTIVTALGGLTYIVLHGTVGGPQMSVAFAIYGGLVLACAVQTIRFARARQWRIHQEWALRLFFLAIASWLYRVHYAIWIPLTERAAMTPEFSGAFDRLNIWAFFVPYLLLLELILAMQGRGLFARGATP